MAKSFTKLKNKLQTSSSATEEKEHTATSIEIENELYEKAKFMIFMGRAKSIKAIVNEALNLYFSQNPVDLPKKIDI